MSVYIRGKFVITMDKNRRVIKNGCVAVSDDLIEAVGKCEELDRDYRGKAEFVLGSERHIVLPGLIDTHVHMVQGMLKGCADNVSLITWLKDIVWPLQGNMREEEALASASLTVLDMIKSGTTTFLETGMVGRYGIDNIVEMVLKSGLRAAIGRHVMDLSGYALEENVIHPGLRESGEFSFKDTLRLYRKYHGRDGRIFIWFAPRTPGAVSRELYMEVAERARELGTGVTLHLAEVREDVEYTKKVFGLKPVEFAHSLGLTGDNVVLVHMVWVDDSEISLLARTGTNVSHNPSSNMKLGSGAARVADMLRAGVNVTLGCDGGPSNDNYDLIEEMKIAALLGNLIKLDPKALTPYEVLEMATVRGAKALGLSDKVGSIEVGKKADIITINYWDPKLIPMVNPISHIVYAAHGNDVSDLIINGRVVMKDREVLTLDEERVLSEARKRAFELFRRTGLCQSLPEGEA